MSGEWDGLRAAAEAATTPMTCGGHRSMGSLMRCQECLTRANGASDLATAATPTVVLEILDRLQAAEAAVERVRDLAWDWEQDAGPFGTDTFGIARAAQAVTAAVDGPRTRATAPLSASGAESDHGGRRDGEGLG